METYLLMDTTQATYEQFDRTCIWDVSSTPETTTVMFEELCTLDSPEGKIKEVATNEEILIIEKMVT